MKEALSSLTCENNGGPYFPSLPAPLVETQGLRSGRDDVCHVVKSHRLQICKLGLPGMKDLVQSGKARIKFHQWVVSVILCLQQNILNVEKKGNVIMNRSTCQVARDGSGWRGDKEEAGTKSHGFLAAQGVAASNPCGGMTLVFSSPYSMEGTWPPATADHPTQPASYWFIFSNCIKCLYCARNWDDCWELNL